MNTSTGPAGWLACVLAGLGIPAGATPAATGGYVWIEAEKPTVVPTIHPPADAPQEKGYAFTGWGNTNVMSEGKVLSINIPDRQAAGRLGPEGAVFGYDFSVPSAGRYNIWARIGFEHVRSDFDWRVDAGPWETLPASRQTQDVYPIQTWNELAWVLLGRRDLAAGRHRLSIRHVPQTRTKTETRIVDGARRQIEVEVPARTLHVSDCFCILRGEFRPNGKYRPDADYQGPADRAAARCVYRMPPAAGAERVSVELTGPWQTARWEEQEVREEERLRGVKALPDMEKLYWYGIDLPADRNAVRPEMAFWHRYLYRTRVDVPASLAGRGFLLEFQNFNMVATVFVNGVRCGESRACSTEWRCDVTAGIRPGRVNEVVVVFKDCYYAIRGDAERSTRSFWNLPPAWLGNQGVGHRFDMPIGWDTRTGILEPVTLVACGSVYTDDAFCKPSVAEKRLALELTLRNTGPQAATVEVVNKVVPWNGGKGGRCVKAFAPRTVSVPAGGTARLEPAEPWADPRLWWPDDPHLYWLVTKVLRGGKVLDIRRTRFGFRQWTWEGDFFRLNGVKWPMWADCDYGPTPQQWLARARTSGMRMIRYWRRAGWGGMTRREVLDYMDEHGVPVRDSGIFDGEHALYGLVRTVHGERRADMALFGNWLEQMKAWVRAERNHPSVFLWSIENEIVYINSHNLGRANWVEPVVRDCAREIMKLDPTRPVMVDGGRCLMDNSLPVNGCHYNDTSGVAQRDYPDAAYTREHWYRTKHRGAWEMVPGRPIFHGECFYANGYTPAEFAGLGGERCFVGLAETYPARGLYARMLSEGWRWCDVAAWHMWFGQADRTYYQAWQPVCVLCRQWNWTFASGATVRRTLKVFNSTRHAGPIDAGWELRVAGRPAGRWSRTFHIPPGEAECVEVSVPVPRVSRRTEGQFVLTCRRGGREVYRDVKAVSILDPDAAPRPEIAPGELVVIDPNGAVKARLRQRGVPFVEADGLDAVRRGTKLLLVGPDAVSPEQSTDPRWLALAASGTRMLVLDQAHPLHYQALPADLDITDHTGRIAFREDAAHPALAGLTDADFFTWSGDHVIYRNAYRKASRGARSLVQCDWKLGDTALAACSINDGLMLLCQLAAGTKLRTDPVARRLFDNLLNHLAGYAPVRKPTVLVVDAASPKGRLLRSMGLKYSEATDPLEALARPGAIAVIDATPANLRRLASAATTVRDFARAGGWVMLWGVTPEGLADYNRIVGFEHLIRPFRMERVVLAVPRDPLTAGLTLRDVVMESPERVASWMGVRWAADDAFTYILDYDEIGPFCRLPSPAEMGKPPDVAHPKSDHWPPNLFNGFTADDSWRYCFSILLDRGDATKWTMHLPREETVTAFSIVLNVIYHKITKIRLYFDDDPAPVELATRPTHDRQDFAIPDRKARRITIELAEWEKSGRSNVIGIDNMWIRVRRPEQFLREVRPLLNIGGLMRYRIGEGGILLNQLHIPQREALPLNAEKKANITRVLLKNLGAVFAAARTVVVGSDLACEPVAFEDGRPNAYLTRRARVPWFAGRGDLGHLPVGRQVFAGVPFELVDFRTSPVPGCFMLKGPGSRAGESEIRDIRVGRRCDALFFLHTLNAGGRLTRWQPPRRGDPTQPTVFQYVVHYADGKRLTVPVVWGRGVGHWVCEKPQALMDAAVAWAAPFPGEKTARKAVLYAMQWNNPRPEVAVRSVDFALGPDGDRWGAPALLAITAARLRK